MLLTQPAFCVVSCRKGLAVDQEELTDRRYELRRKLLPRTRRPMWSLTGDRRVSVPVAFGLVAVALDRLQRSARCGLAGKAAPKRSNCRCTCSPSKVAVC